MSRESSLHRWALVLLLVACGEGKELGDAGVDAGLERDAAADDAAAGDATEPDAGEVLHPDAEPRRVLFIGNSFTSHHDVPNVVRTLAAASGAPLEVEMIAVGGALLYQHAINEATLARARAGGFDFVVLQGQSAEPIIFPEAFEQGAELFGVALDEAGARSVWFATWARAEGHSDYPSMRDPAWMTWALEQRYAAAADRFDGALARVGGAFLLARAELPEVVLHHADGSHASSAGSFLAGCVLTHALTGLIPEVPEPPPLGLASETARALCALTTRVAPAIEPCYGILCDGQCVAPTTNPAHCGGCNLACGAEEPCRGGVCGCDPPLTACARGCHDVSSSTTHCGGCGVVCELGELCRESACRCAAAELAAAGSGFADFSRLTAQRAGCAPAGYGHPSLASRDCREAAHALCAAHGACFTSGLPPATGHAPTSDAALCVRGEVRAVAPAALQSFAPECVELEDLGSPACAAAVSRYCASVGAVSGFGPVGARDGELLVTCLGEATVVRTPFDTLRGFASRCLPDPITCQIAAHNYCEAQGYVGGFGPVESAGDDVEVVCVGR